jgi:hypothetical protein
MLCCFFQQALQKKKKFIFTHDVFEASLKVDIDHYTHHIHIYTLKKTGPKKKKK